jgi:hypothetical protein
VTHENEKSISNGTGKVVKAGWPVHTNEYFRYFRIWTDGKEQENGLMFGLGTL